MDKNGIMNKLQTIKKKHLFKNKDALKTMEPRRENSADCPSKVAFNQV